MRHAFILFAIIALSPMAFGSSATPDQQSTRSNIAIDLPYYGDIMNFIDQPPVNFSGRIELQINGQSATLILKAISGTDRAAQAQTIAVLDLVKDGSKFEIMNIKFHSNGIARFIVFKVGGVFDFSGALSGPTGGLGPEFLTYRDVQTSRLIRFSRISGCSTVLRGGRAR